jgi:hypothetical protein
MITAVGTAALLLSVGGALAQSRPDATELTGSSSEPAADSRVVDGKVVELERRPDLVTMLRLDNGTSLRVAPESQGPGESARVGDSIIARYQEDGRSEKVATLVRVIEMQAP